ncbi:MAG: hypothetical protein HC924_04535 [Synechococcaceae cyanobacterium SM2_3_2]|nr:hypothetical protein [Synechococcaceae cyanobacterium SM2_3_2]
MLPNEISQIQASGIHLLEQENYTEALNCLRAIPTPNLSLAIAIIQLAKTHEQKDQLDKALYLREIAAEWDPNNHDNYFYLIGLASTLEDEWRVALHSQALLELWQTRQDLDIPTLRKVLSMSIPQLLERGYNEYFFTLLATYCENYLSGQDQRSIFGLLAILALTHCPDMVSEFDGLWDPLDLTRPIIRDTMNFFKKSTVRGSSLLAYYLEQEAMKLDAENLLEKEQQFYLLAETIEYHLHGSQHQKAQEIIQYLLSHWPLSVLEQLSPQPGLNKGSHRLFFDFSFKLCFHMPYLSDNRSKIRSYQKCSETALSRFDIYKHPDLVTPQFSKTTPPTKIGYLGLAFNKHPVGFLSYQSILHHDPTQFQVYCYDISPENSSAETDFIRAQLESRIPNFCDLRRKPWKDVVRTIQQDQIDILVYMDASTNPIGFQILPFRPAPIQMSWLGGDSPAIPEIDYFIVDPYILPDDAQADYDETLLRLPTFAAVDSFEVGELDPEQARHNLDVPADAILFWTAANAAKRSPESIQAQLEILKHVPNGFLAIKGLGDTVAVSEAYRQLATQKGIENRLRFIKTTQLEENHRAQLTIADLVLDTFPYTGATHTFEALYVGTPVLTVVGRHYYGRMSYSLLKNCQLEDCITYSMEDYIQRGIQLGSDREFLDRVKVQVKGSRSSSVIWDAKGFTRSLEAVYQQVVKNRIR